MSDRLRVTDDIVGAAAFNGLVMHAKQTWDAGDIGCGELLIELRMRMKELTAGEVFQLVARDLGAVEDLPSWCNLTGHKLLKAEHPEYWIQKKEG